MEASGTLSVASVVAFKQAQVQQKAAYAAAAKTMEVQKTQAAGIEQLLAAANAMMAKANAAVSGSGKVDVYA
jgi:hypothetical protein